MSFNGSHDKTSSDLKNSDEVEQNRLAEGEKNNDDYYRYNQNHEDEKQTNELGDADDDRLHEPLGYRNFLYDVNIEYNRGDNKQYSNCNRHSFKLKYLPYMIERKCSPSPSPSVASNSPNERRKFSLASNSSNGSLNNCDNNNIYATTIDQSCRHSQVQNNSSNNSSIIEFTLASNQEDNCFEIDLSKHLDVTRETCAFLGNSDHVPNFNKIRKRRVTLELISAKLSQSSNHGFSKNSSHTSLVTLAEQPTIEQQQTGNFGSENYSPPTINQSQPTTSLTTSPLPSPIVPVSSKRYVNYAILIKTTPGLDKQPAVIERRFSDFLKLYQGLKANGRYSKLVDQHVNFPKKVYMGNFSLTNIAERSLEFSRLLNLCMIYGELLWSTPFISFLLDKELKEAHRLSLFGDPDDVQASIETAYYIVKKLYLKFPSNTTDQSSSNSLSTFPSQVITVSGQQQTEPSNGSLSSISSSSPLEQQQQQPAEASFTSTNVHDETISSGCVDATRSLSESQFNSRGEQENNANTSSGGSSSNDDSNSLSIRRNLASLNQRLLVTFCMLFLTYYRTENYQDLKVVVKDFNLMISSQDYVDSMLNTRHYVALRACLLFLMNMHKGCVIDDSQRLWLRRRLEDIDGAHADWLESFNSTMMMMNNGNLRNQVISDGANSSRRSSRSAGSSADNSLNNGSFRVTRGDLTSLIRDRNFCLFQDSKFSG